MNWRAHAACRLPANVDVFHAEMNDNGRDSGRARGLERACRLICSECAVQPECAEFAMHVSTYDVAGVLGGMTERERRAAQRRAGIRVETLPYVDPTRDPPAHGTYAGYRRHLREASVPCQGCLEAHNERRRQWEESPSAERRSLAEELAVLARGTRTTRWERDAYERRQRAKREVS